jgi:hypothetical protein
MTTASSTLLSIAASGTFAPLMSAASGTPRPSVRMCRFTPIFARSVGFGPVRSPLLAPSLRRCRASSTSTRCRDGHRRSSATLGGWLRTRRAVPTSGNEGGTSSQSRNHSAAPSTDNPSSADTGCPPSRFELQPEAGLRAASLAPEGSMARSSAKGRRARQRTWLPPAAIDHTRSACSRGFRIGSKTFREAGKYFRALGRNVQVLVED